MSSFDSISRSVHQDKFEGHRVRLFPSVRIGGQREAELRANSSLLAILKAVSDFGRSVVKAAGGPAGRLECFSEVPFTVEKPDGPKEVRPDGVIHVSRGKRDWSAFVEVKVGDNPLEQVQFDEYHKLARDQGYSAFITVSNQAATPNGLPPLNVDGRRLRSVPVVHLSWARLLSEARMLSRLKEVDDPDQFWMLQEWIRYLVDKESKIIEPPTLGKHWGEVLSAAKNGTLPSVSKSLIDVVGRWDGYLAKAALQLRAKLGAEVEVRVPRKERHDPELRVKRLHAEALESGCLQGEFKVKNAVGDISLEMLLPGGTVRYGIEVKPRSQGRQKTRLNWILGQLKHAIPPGLMLRVQWDHGRTESQGQVEKLIEDSVITDHQRLWNTELKTSG